MRHLWLVGISLLAIGCATTQPKRIDYSQLSLDEYIDQFQAPLTTVSYHEYAYRAINLSGGGIDTKSTYRSFSEWCSARHGRITNTYTRFLNGQGGYMDYGKYVSALRYVTFELTGKHDSEVERECIGDNGAPIAAYRLTSDKKLVFFSTSELNHLAREQDAIKLSKANEERAKQQREELERRKIAQCRFEESQKLQANLKPGMYTDLGMVVEAKPPIASIQVIDRGNPSVVWVKISTLQIPLGSPSCSRSR